jgi:hypothetical protein
VSPRSAANTFPLARLSRRLTGKARGFVPPCTPALPWRPSVATVVPDRPVPGLTRGVVGLTCRERSSSASSALLGRSAFSWRRAVSASLATPVSPLPSGGCRCCGCTCPQECRQWQTRPEWVTGCLSWRQTHEQALRPRCSRSSLSTAGRSLPVFRRRRSSGGLEPVVDRSDLGLCPAVAVKLLSDDRERSFALTHIGALASTICSR